MSSGGRRVGAGRKRQLRSLQEQLWCWAEVDARKRKMAAQCKEAAYCLQFQFDDLRRLRQRQAELAERGEHRDEKYKQILADLAIELETIGRFHSIPLKRSYGFNDAIFEDVARQASQHFGRRITGPNVGKTWKRWSARLKGRSLFDFLNSTQF